MDKILKCLSHLPQQLNFIHEAQFHPFIKRWKVGINEVTSFNLILHPSQQHDPEVVCWAARVPDQIRISQHSPPRLQSPDLYTLDFYNPTVSFSRHFSPKRRMIYKSSSVCIFTDCKAFSECIFFYFQVFLRSSFFWFYSPLWFFVSVALQNSVWL